VQVLIINVLICVGMWLWCWCKWWLRFHGSVQCVQFPCT